MFTMTRSSVLAAFTAVAAVALAADTLEGTARAHDASCAVPAAQLLSFGGAAVASPRIVPVTFSSDPLGASVQDFLPKLARDHGIASVLSEYGVGGMEVAPPIRLDEAPPAQITNTQVAAFIAGKIQSGAFPPADARSVYVLVYPDGTEVDREFFFGTFSACDIGDAFHDVASLPSGASVPIVVSPRCAGPFLGSSGLDRVTLALSAEVADAVTDPFFDGYSGTDFNGSAFSSLTNASEIADLCLSLPGPSLRPASIGYTVSRLWSNSAAKAGREPCLPAAAPDRYFNAYPAKIDGTRAVPFFDTQGISLAPGGEITIPVRLFGNERGPRSWQLSAASLTSPFGGPSDPFGQLTFSFDRTMGGDGDVRYLTISRTASPPPDAANFFLGFAIQSTSGSETHVWPVIVGD